MLEKADCKTICVTVWLDLLLWYYYVKIPKGTGKGLKEMWKNEIGCSCWGILFPEHFLSVLAAIRASLFLKCAL